MAYAARAAVPRKGKKPAGLKNKRKQATTERNRGPRSGNRCLELEEVYQPIATK